MKLEKHGIYKNYEYAIMMNERMCFRCAYVRIPETHPYYGLPKEKIHIENHDGDDPFSYITNLGFFDEQGHWFGFACDHMYDLKDLNAIREYRGEEEYLAEKAWQESLSGYRHCWTTEDCEEECKDMIERLLQVLE